MKKGIKRKARDEEPEEILSDTEKGTNGNGKAGGKGKEKALEDPPLPKRPRFKDRSIPKDVTVSCFARKTPFDPTEEIDPEDIHYSKSVGTPQHQNVQFIKYSENGGYNRLWWDTEGEKALQFAPDYYRDPNPSPQRRNDPTFTVPYPLSMGVEHDRHLIMAMKALDSSHLDFFSSPAGDDIWSAINIDPKPTREEIEANYCSPLKPVGDADENGEHVMYDLRSRFARTVGNRATYKIYKKKSVDSKYETEIEPHKIFPGDSARMTFKTDTLYIRPVDKKKIKAIEAARKGNKGKKKKGRKIGRFTCGMEANVIEMHVGPDTKAQIIDKE